MKTVLALMLDNMQELSEIAIYVSKVVENRTPSGRPPATSLRDDQRILRRVKVEQQATLWKVRKCC